MKIAICNTKQNDWSLHLCQAAANGITKCGDTYAHVRNEEHFGHLVDCDAAIVTCDAFPERTDATFAFRNGIASICKFRNVPRLVFETGFMHNIRALQRQETTPGRLYWAAGWDGLKRNADYCVPKDADGSRFRWLELPNIPKRRNLPETGHVLVYGQVDGGVVEVGVDLDAEYMKVARACREHLPRTKLVFRPHPQVMARDIPREYERPLAQMGYEVDPFHSTRLLLQGARVAVTWMSNAAVDALLMGVPLICLSECNIAWDVAEHDLSRIADPAVPPLNERQRFVERLAWCQWTIEEVASGMAWNHLRRKVTR